MKIRNQDFDKTSKNLLGFEHILISKKNEIRKFSRSKTIYVGNLSYHTKEEKIWNLFFKAGKIKRIIIGLNRYNYTPCGFCFLEFYKFSDAGRCIFFLNGTKLDNRTLKIDLDRGFLKGRQFGRGKRGGQIQDEKGVKKVLQI